MRLTKEETISEVIVITEALKGHFEELKIRADHLTIPENVVDLKSEDIKIALEWLRGICHNQHSALVKARKLLTPDQWKRYALWGDDFDEHQEVIILKKAQVELRKVLVSKDRPNLFKKGYVNGQHEISEKAVHKGKQQRKVKRSEPSDRCDAESVHGDERHRE